MNQATRIFIDEHTNDDVALLSLQAARFPDVDIPFAIRQISGKQKVREKIPTFYNCRELLYPLKLSLEQSSSEITAKHKSALCEGEVLYDMTGGFGVDCFFLSSRFRQVFYVEAQTELCQLAEHNFSALGRANISIINDTAENFLNNCGDAHWIYLDPARRLESGKKAVLLSDCEPNVALLQDKLLEKSTRVMIKLSPMFDIAALRHELKHIREIHIVAVANECREIIVMLERNYNAQPEIKTTNYSRIGTIEKFEFTAGDEQGAEITFTTALRQYLYEPNAAIMKSGAFGLISEKFRLSKLHINSHLYTSDCLIDDFPGRIFCVQTTIDFSKKSLSNLNDEVKKANLTIRNFPLTVNELRKKLKIPEGGDVYLLATTLADNKKVLVKCSKVK
jgi:16S rRNA G966 N2-methylase RsmD